MSKTLPRDSNAGVLSFDCASAIAASKYVHGDTEPVSVTFTSGQPIIETGLIELADQARQLVFDRINDLNENCPCRHIRILSQPGNEGAGRRSRG
jgi:hypothetical protein